MPTMMYRTLEVAEYEARVAMIATFISYCNRRYKLPDPAHPPRDLYMVPEFSKMSFLTAGEPMPVSATCKTLTFTRCKVIVMSPQNCFEKTVWMNEEAWSEYRRHMENVDWAAFEFEQEL